MQTQKAASTPRDKRQSAKKDLYCHYSTSEPKNQYSGKSKKRYPRSDRSINLSKPCPYCNYTRGLIIVRDKYDKGFCRCGKCDSALFSLNENKSKQGLTHISEILDSYLPYGEVRK